MKWIKSLFGARKREVNAGPFSAEGVMLLTGNTTIVANVLARADQGRVQSILMGMHKAKERSLVPEDALVAASMMPATYGVFERLPAIDAPLMEWVTASTEIFQSIEEHFPALQREQDEVNAIVQSLQKRQQGQET